MRKFTLLIASLFITIGAMAQTFVEPEVGKYYKIKGDNTQYPWLTGNASSGGCVTVSANESEAAIFLKTANGLQVAKTGKYLYYSGSGDVTIGDTETSVTIGDNSTDTENGKKYSIKVGNAYMFNNNTDQQTHTSGAFLNIERYWGFIEVAPNISTDKYYAIDSYKDYLYAKTDGTMDLYCNATTVDTKALWQFVELGGGVYNIKNVHTGLFVGANSKMTSDEESYGKFQLRLTNIEDNQIGSAGDGKMYIKFNGETNYECLHSTANVVKSWAGAGLGNQYSFVEVDEFSHTLNVTDAGWATVVLGFNAAIPTTEGFKAYTIASQEDGYVTLAEATGVLAANVPVLVNAPAGNYDFAYTTEETTVTESGLQGTLYNKDITVAGAYVLGLVDGKVGFGKAKTTGKAEGTFTNNANKAYFVPTNTQANAASYSFRFGEGTTGVDQITENREQSTVIYDLTGRRVENPSNGIYIINGVKTLVK